MPLTWLPNGIRTSVVVLSEANSPPGSQIPPSTGLVSTYNGFGIIPASESPAGFAITNNYYGAGEVDFWNLVDNDDTNGQGWFFYQKTGTSTAKNVAALYSGSIFSELGLYSPTEAVHVSIGVSEIEAWVGTASNNAFVLFTNNINRLLISATGYLYGGANNVGEIPSSQPTVGFAITNNYSGYGEVDFWNLVNNDDTNEQGWHFKQKTGATTFKDVVGIGSNSGDSFIAVSSPDGTCVAIMNVNNTRALIGSNGNIGVDFTANGLSPLTIGADGVAVTVNGSLLQNKSVATPLTGTTITMIANQRYQAIAPAGTIAALTLVLPPSPADSQAVSAGSSQIITALTVNAGTGGAARVGAPTTLAASSGFTMIYQASNNTWYLTA